ncbi:Mlo-related protein [Parasponia andersonii]|uniref:MLO-like protein n=1 Tax=Parasponia andersonii TaxID=3476 RepID=A0A2P5BKQ8_PARAD|nr:Mlo-related protein [Parasponia andersonii]
MKWVVFFLFSPCLWLLLLVGLATAASSDGNERKLDQTPTWAVAGVCAVIIIISIALEKVLHRLGTWFTDRHKRALFEALEKVKAELMILGFISLLLTFGQSYIARICIPIKVAQTMLPCARKEVAKSGEEEHRRKLLWFEHRFLAAAGSAPKCKTGHEPLISVEGLHQLHILIFFLAVFHVLFSGITMMLGRLKIRGWKKWEQETSTHDYEFSNDPSRFRLTHETSFVRAHTSFWTRIPFFFYIGCFFRQFFRSVSKSDYLTLRNGFITVHLAPGSKFNFQKYIKRSLEDDFKLVVGVSPVLWASFVVFLLLNIEGWQALFWASLIPLIIILAVGIELQSILTKMALEITERHAVVQGIPLVQGSDKYFWFGRPHLVLHLIHFALFQNAFQITYFLWIWYSFGLKSCFHANFKLAIAKVAVGVGVLCLCSYITLPLYALVTQMGSGMKKSIFDGQTSKALKKWHMAVKKKQGGGRGPKSPTITLGGSSTVSKVHSSGHTLHRFKTTGHSTRSSAYEDHETSDVESDLMSPTLTTNLIVRVDHDEEETEINEPQSREQETRSEDDFSFVKPAPPK